MKNGDTFEKPSFGAYSLKHVQDILKTPVLWDAWIKPAPYIERVAMLRFNGAEDRDIHILNELYEEWAGVW